MTKKLVRLIIFLIVIFPILYLGIWAFVERWPFEELLPKTISFRGWKSLFNNQSNMKILFSSTLISLVVAFLSVGLSYPACKALALYDIKGKGLIRMILFIPIILPVTSVAIGLHLNFLRIGLANTVLGVILVHIFPCIPYCIMTMEPVFSSVGENYENQAMLLGAKGWQRFFYINLPLVMPGLRTAFFMSFVVSFSQYFLTFLIGGGIVRTYPMIMFPIISNKDRHEAAVYSLVFLFVCLLVAFMCFAFRRKEEVG